MSAIREFIRFSRLHTVIGTTLSIAALYLLASSFSDRSALHLPELAFTLLSCLGANIYIVGLNQITDIDIDRINKPWLPLASGAYTLRTGYRLIFVSVLLSLGIALWFGRFLLLTVLLSLALGTAYSLPPFRLKRFPFWAAFCILAVRGLIVNLLLFLHFNDRINGSQQIPPLLWLLTAAIFIYSIIIAWFKDIPDMEGDRHYRIQTFSLKLGARAVFQTGCALLAGLYLVLILLPFRIDFALNRMIFAGAHGVLLALFSVASFRVCLSEPASVRWYYQFIWVLFFLEYASFVVGRLTE